MLRRFFLVAAVTAGSFNLCTATAVLGTRELPPLSVTICKGTTEGSGPCITYAVAYDACFPLKDARSKLSDKIGRVIVAKSQLCVFSADEECKSHTLTLFSGSYNLAKIPADMVNYENVPKSVKCFNL